MKNSYQSPAKLFVSEINAKASPTVIYSKEGATQGDPAAMAMYTLGTRPLIDEVGKNSTGQDFYKQVWYADDASAAGKLEGLKEWWDKVVRSGPDYGYNPNAEKTILIVKRTEDLLRAKTLFSNTGVNITCEGERHLGAVIGSDDFRTKYIQRNENNYS